MFGRKTRQRDAIKATQDLSCAVLESRIKALEEQVVRCDGALGEARKERDKYSAALEELAKKRDAAQKECHEAQKERDAALRKVVERKVWRVRAKAVELATLAQATGNGLPEHIEFWRAARKLGVPMDEVKDYKLHQDSFEFYNWSFDDPSTLSVCYNTTVYEVG